MSRFTWARTKQAGLHTGLFVGGGKQLIIGNTVCKVQCPTGPSEAPQRWGGCLSQRGDAAEGSNLEVRSADYSAQSAEKNFRLHFQLSGWALVALSYSKD